MPGLSYTSPSPNIRIIYSGSGNVTIN
jgi:hypothetical protein